jgi:hypothetical protein
MDLRFKPLLPFVISKEQSGYVEGRQILDSVILSHEAIHSLKSSHIPNMIIKIDLSKSFDKLSWQYMKSLILGLGFSNDWVDWVLSLTSSTFFSILVNESPSQTFTPSRGIHQGYPLSPFLFVVMDEGLSCYIKASIANDSLHSFPLHGIQPSVSINQFVDDTMMMGSPNAREALKNLQQPHQF